MSHADAFGPLTCVNLYIYDKIYSLGERKWPQNVSSPIGAKNAWFFFSKSIVGQWKFVAVLNHHAMAAPASANEFELASPPTDGISRLRFAPTAPMLMVNSWDSVRSILHKRNNPLNWIIKLFF
jgi:hypothetical protein